jgi:hypothetical protein
MALFSADCFAFSFQAHYLLAVARLALFLGLLLLYLFQLFGLLLNLILHVVDFEHYRSNEISRGVLGVI